MYICTYRYTCTLHIKIYIYIYIYRERLCVYIYMYMYMYIYIYIYIHREIFMYIHKLCMYMYTYIYIYIFIYRSGTQLWGSHLQQVKSAYQTWSKLADTYMHPSARIPAMGMGPKASALGCSCFVSKVRCPPTQANVLFTHFEHRVRWPRFSIACGALRAKTVACGYVTNYMIMQQHIAGGDHDWLPDKSPRKRCQMSSPSQGRTFIGLVIWSPRQELKVAHTS